MSTTTEEVEKPIELSPEEKQAVETRVNEEFNKLAQEKGWNEKVQKMQRPKKLQSAMDVALARKVVLAENSSLSGEGKEKELEKAIKKKLDVMKARADVEKTVKDEKTAHENYVTSVENRINAQRKLESAEKGKSQSVGIPKEKIEKLLESA